MTTTTHAEAVDQIRIHLDQARREGRRPPGRPALVEATGLTDHAVRTALDKIKDGGGPSQTPGSIANHRQPVAASRETTSPGDTRQTSNLQSVANSKPASATSGWSPIAGPRASLAPTRRPGETTSRRSAENPSDTSATSEHSRAGGRTVSWLGFAFGSATSIAANVLHTWLPAGTQPPGWTPGVGPQIGAGVWPIALIVTVEVLTRVHWRRTWLWNAVRYGIGTIVAIGSFAISYGHIHAVLTAWHYDPLAAAIGPLVLDGLMTISGFALLTGENAREGGAKIKS